MLDPYVSGVLTVAGMIASWYAGNAAARYFSARRKAANDMRLTAQEAVRCAKSAHAQIATIKQHVGGDVLDWYIHPPIMDRLDRLESPPPTCSKCGHDLPKKEKSDG